MYQYLVVYGFNTGRGTIQVTTSRRAFDSFDAIQSIADYIEGRDDAPEGRVTILNIIPIKKWWEFWK